MARDKEKEYQKEYNKNWNENNKEQSKETSKNWRKNKSLYSSFAHQLTIDESPISGNEGFLQVKCTYCGKYYYPTNSKVRSRVSSLVGKNTGECRLYCSEECKQAGPIFAKKTITPGVEHGTSREVQPQLRLMVLERDGYECQNCHKIGVELHCHHIIPVRLDPLESADIDNCITYCKECHHKVHQQEGCTAWDIANSCI